MEDNHTENNRTFLLKVRENIEARLFPKDLPETRQRFFDVLQLTLLSIVYGFFLSFLIIGIFEVNFFIGLVLTLGLIIIFLLFVWWRDSPKIAAEKRHKMAQLAELEEAKRLSYLGIMATAAAHEINQPIGIIRATVGAALADIEEGYFQPEEIKPVLERILTQTERVSGILENFRRFARGDRTQREKVEINPLVERVVGYFIQQFQDRGIVLRTELWIKSGDLTTWSNSLQLEEVLINLLTNARDAIEGQEGATVWVKTRILEDGSIEIVVEDNGPGLPPEYRRHLFVPFVSTKSTEKGTGLGLHISRRFIDDLGGHLRYQDRPHGGACFVVDLPPLKG